MGSWLGSFPVQNGSIFGDAAVAIVNDKNVVQLYDSYSVLQIKIESEATAGYPVPVKLLVENRTDSEALELRAENGILSVPRIRIQATPSQSITLALKLTLYDQTSNFTETTQRLTVVTRACKAGEIITKNGTCETCVGPDSYLLAPPSSDKNALIEI